MTGPRASQGGTEAQEAQEAREAVYRGGARPRRRQAPACPSPPHARELGFLRCSTRAAGRLFPGPSGQCRRLSQGRLILAWGLALPLHGRARRPEPRRPHSFPFSPSIPLPP